MSTKSTKERTKALKAYIKRQQQALEQSIESYALNYYDYLQDYIHINKMTGIVTRKSDGLTGTFNVLKRHENFALLEPYVIYFVPLARHYPSEAIYKVENVLKNYIKK